MPQKRTPIGLEVEQAWAKSSRTSGARSISRAAASLKCR